MVLVVGMMLILLVGGVSTLVTYRGVFHELAESFRDRTARDDLRSAVGRLNEYLPAVTGDDGVARLQRDAFQKQLQVVTEKLSNYKREVDGLPLDPRREAARRVTSQAVVDVLESVSALRRSHEEMMQEPPSLRDASLFAILRDVDELQLKILYLPDFTTGFQDTLEHAESARKRSIWMMGVSCVIVSVFFFGLVYYGRRFVLKPLRTLHEGAVRVAGGDFDHRVQLTAPEEMADLAEAFNCMTDNFQEIRDDLDRQVRERFKQLVRSERLAGIGFLSAGVAHEINNPMQAIAFAAESLESRVPEPHCEEERQNVEVMRQYLGMIQREASRCQQITRKLLEFSRGNGEARGRHDLTAIVNEVLSLVRPMTKYQDRNIIFERKTPCIIDANGPEIQQVVLNFVSNALEAMDPGCTLNIAITEQAGQVVLTFKDDGCGMTQEVMDNLFEPFFTQRKDGKGTGLGLSISHRIISVHGGTIDADSEGPGKGSCFRVILPRNSFRAGSAA